MLREIKRVRTIRGEHPRRWFNDNEMDLIVWIDGKKEIAGFQLAYDKHILEYALTWMRSSGFQYDRVDNGEGRLRKYKATPILIPCKPQDIDNITAEFKNKSEGIDQGISQFVYEKLVSITNYERVHN